MEGILQNLLKGSYMPISTEVREWICNVAYLLHELSMENKSAISFRRHNLSVRRSTIYSSSFPADRRAVPLHLHSTTTAVHTAMLLVENSSGRSLSSGTPPASSQTRRLQTWVSCPPQDPCSDVVSTTTTWGRARGLSMNCDRCSRR